MAVADPFGVVTTTSTAPAACAGVVIVMVVGESSVMLAAFPPNTTEAPKKFVPVMVTGWPPESGPVAGSTLVIVGVGR